MKSSNPLKLPFSVGLILLVLLSCHRDDFIFIPTHNEDPADFAQSLDVYKGQAITIETVLFEVVNEFGVPIKDAYIGTGFLSGVTDEKGMLMLHNVDAFENFFTATISKSPYIVTNKTIIPTDETNQLVEVVMIQNDLVESINSGSDITVRTNNDASVTLNGTYFNVDGSTYEGAVKVSLNYLSPDDENTLQTMPGNLVAQNSNGGINVLETYGMFSVNLSSSSGEKLNINEENKATIRIPIAASQLSIAPETIPLWYFDHELGIWIEEGEAVKEGSIYVGQVSHFSWWNCDLPMDLVNLRLFVVNTHGKLVPYQQVDIIRTSNGQKIFEGTTDRLGKISGPIPKNEQITIRVYDENLHCINGSLVLEETYGPFNKEKNNLTTPVEYASEIMEYEVLGTIVNCDGSTSTDSYVELIYLGTTHVIFPDENGNFWHEFIACEGDEMSLKVYDMINKKVMTHELDNFIDNVADLGVLQPCDSYAEKIYQGNLIISSIQEFDDFAKLGYTCITGKLLIKESNLSNFIGLESLTTIGENLLIDRNSNLISFEGLNNLTSIGYAIAVYDNDKLVDISALKNIHSINWLEFTDNESLINLNGMHNLVSVDEMIYIDKNTNLTSLAALEKITTVESLVVGHNTNLKSLYGLHNITTIGEGRLLVSFNSELTSMEGLESLTEIGGTINIESNDKLLSLAGLENLLLVEGYLSIRFNNLLSDFCALKNISINGAYNVIENDYNPTLEQMHSSTECSQ